MNLQQLLDDYGKSYDAIENKQTLALFRTFENGWQQLESEYLALAARIKQAEEAGEPVSPSWAFRQDRYQTLMQQIEDTNNALAGVTSAEIDAGVEAAASLGAKHAEGLTGAIQPAVVGTFSSLPLDAVKAIAGAANDKDSPVHQLINSIAGADVGSSLSREITNGIVTGRNPNVTARRMKQQYAGETLARYTRIARTETMRAYREGAHQSYLRNNDIVEEWMWTAARQSRTCACCWAMSGTRHPLTERLDGHPNCRCRAIPVPYSAQQLGLPEGIDVTPSILSAEQSGDKLFADLPDSTKIAILGPAKFKAYSEKKITLADLVERKESQVWGSMRTESSLASALKRAEERKKRPAATADGSPDSIKQAEDPVLKAMATAKTNVNRLVRAAKKYSGQQGYSPDLQEWMRTDIPGEDVEVAFGRNAKGEMVASRNGKMAERSVTKAGKVLLDRACADAGVDPKEWTAASDRYVLLKEQHQQLVARQMKSLPSTSPEYRRLEPLVRQSLNARTQAMQEYKALNEKVMPNVTNLVSQYGKLGGEIKTINPRSPVTKALNSITLALPTRWIEAAQKRELRVYADPSRAHFTTEFGAWPTVRGAARPVNAVIKVNPAKSSTVLHEATHYMENGQFAVGALAPLQRIFVMRRAGNEPINLLQDLRPGSGYGAHEKAYADRFHDPYIGKVYTDAHHEVLSMGMESLWFRNTKMTDPDHLAFTVGCILVA